MAPKRKSKAAKPAAKAAAKSGKSSDFFGNFTRYAEKNPTATLVGIIAVVLGLMLIFG